MEQRKARRFELRLPFELIRGGVDSHSSVGETKNLSSSGVLFRSDINLRIGEPVEYLITLPTSQAPNEPVRLRCVGKVVRQTAESDVAATLERYEFVR